MNEGWLDSTEVLEAAGLTWRLTAPLPSARYGLRAASVENSIFVFGENFLFYIDMEHVIVTYCVSIAGGYDVSNLEDILSYNKNHTWEAVGQMKEARHNHALGVLEDVSQLCP